MNQTMRAVLIVAATAVCAPPVVAQAPAPIDPLNAARSLQAARLAGSAPVIDGKLDDAVWATAAVARDFVQFRPKAGDAATQKTEARVLYDDENVYVAMRMYDTAPDSIRGRLVRRDNFDGSSDWADVIIDSYHDKQTGYRFSVNPRGVLADVYHYDDGDSESDSWDAVWQAKASIDEQGWSAEFRIPLSQLRFAPSTDGSEQVWGIQFARLIARAQEQSFWAPVAPQTPGFTSRFGELHGVRGLGSPRRLEVLPYTVSKLTRAPEPNGAVQSPFWQANATGLSAGADVKYGITSNLTLTGTINPDFGQVEADPSVVNLSAFETFFPERRPFFLEGSSLFSFSVGDDGNGEQLFYSRRIGRAPQRASFAGADYTNVPEATTILGAAKLTGRTAGGWSIGVFDALTQAEDAEASSGGAISKYASEPLTNYGVARVAKDFRGGFSSAGLMLTATNRDLHDDAFAFLRSSAYALGFNGKHRFGQGGKFQVQGYVAGSSIYGDTLAIQLAQRSSSRYYQRPDAEHVEYDPTRTSLQGMAGELSLSKIGGRLNGGIATRFRTPGFEVNDIGFQSGADNAFVYGWINYFGFTPGKVLRNWRVGMNPSSGWDFGGTRLWTQLNLQGNATFQNFWSMNVWGNQRWQAWSTTAMRGGPAIVAPAQNNLSLNVSSDRRKPITGSMNINAFREQGDNGSARVNYSMFLSGRPTSQVELSLSPSYGVSRPAWQYVSTTAARNADGSTRPGETEYIFAALDQRTASLTTRISYTASPTLSFQLYAQPFVSAGDYTTFRRVRDPRADAFGTRFQDFAAAALTMDANNRYHAALDDERHVEFNNPNFNVRALRSNAVVRWEYRPGSTLYLVWSQGRSGSARTGDFSLDRDFNDLMGDAPTNVLLVKLNYWVNF